jgi:Fe-coproporphyrin III synthase
MVPEEIHDKIRGLKGLYRRIMEGVQAVRSCEKRPLLFFSTTIQASNYLHLEQVVEDAIEAGVDGVSIQHLQTRSLDRTSRHNQLFPQYQVRDGWSNDSLRQVNTTILQNALNRAKQKGLFVNVFPVLTSHEMAAWYSDPSQSMNGNRIKCPWVMANIFQDGTIRMCDDIILGDLKEEGFWEIWNGDKMAEFRKQARKSKTFPICATCCSLYRTSSI